MLRPPGTSGGLSAELHFSGSGAACGASAAARDLGATAFDRRPRGDSSTATTF